MKVFDPWADKLEVEREYGISLSEITSAAPVQSLIIAVAHAQFKLMHPQRLKALCDSGVRPVIADLKALFDPGALEAQGCDVFRL